MPEIRAATLDDMAVLVVGAGSALGTRVALAVAQSGTEVLVVDAEQSALDTAARSIGAMAGNAIAVSCDAAQPEGAAVAMAIASELGVEVAELLVVTAVEGGWSESVLRCVAPALSDLAGVMVVTETGTRTVAPGLCDDRLRTLLAAIA